MYNGRIIHLLRLSLRKYITIEFYFVPKCAINNRNTHACECIKTTLNYFVVTPHMVRNSGAGVVLYFEVPVIVDFRDPDFIQFHRPGYTRLYSPDATRKQQ